MPGKVRGQLLGMSVALSTSFRATADGLMAVNVVNCSTVIQQSQFVLDPEGPLSTVVKTFEVGRKRMGCVASAQSKPVVASRLTSFS